MTDFHTESEQDPVEKFLSQPSSYYEEDDAAPPLAPRRVTLPWKKRWSSYWFEKKPSESSNIAPRKQDGTRTKIFFFNGNGRGR